MIISDAKPFSIVEDTGFMDFFGKIRTKLCSPNKEGEFGDIKHNGRAAFKS